MQDLGSLTRDQTRAPCSGSASLNNWITREVLTGSPLNLEKSPWLLPWGWVLRGKGGRLVRRLPAVVVKAQIKAGSRKDSGTFWRLFSIYSHHTGWSL